MTALIVIAILVVGVGGSLYLFGRKHDAKEQGRREVRDAIVQEKLKEKADEAKRYATPPRSISDNARRLRKLRDK